MSNTLRLFSRTLAQVSATPSMAPRAAMLAGAMAIALAASPAHAQGRTAYDLFPQYAAPAPAVQQAPASSPGLSDSATRNVGRTVGGVLGYLTGGAFTKNPITRAVATAGGVLLGQEVADQVNQSSKAQQPVRGVHGEYRPGAVRYALYGSGAAPVGSAKATGSRPLPVDLATNMTNLLVDMVAKRDSTRQAMLEVDRAEVVSATNPRNANALKSVRAAYDLAQQQSRQFTDSLRDYANAIDVLESKGFDVAKHRAAAMEVTGNDIRYDLGLGDLTPAQREAFGADARKAASLSDLREGAAAAAAMAQEERQADGIADAGQRMR